MKIVPVVLASTLLTLGSAAAMAQTQDGGGGAGGAQGGGAQGGAQPQGESVFSMIDQNDDGAIDEKEARRSGISDSQFKEMDQDGNGEISESEFESNQRSRGAGGGGMQ